MRRERRRAKAAPYPRPRGPSPQGCTWDEQKGGWWKADGTEWQRKRIPEPGALKGPTKWTIAFEEECAAREAREKAVRFDSSTVYCAKHLYTLDNEMCSTCAKRGWRDVRAPVRQTGNALGTGEQWLLPPLHSSSGAWLKPCPW